MNWKEEIRKLEQEGRWDTAIEFLQQIIHNYPNDPDPYLFLNFLIMDLLVEREYDRSKHDYYASLLKKYFDESYAKFSDNAEYLYITAKTAVMSEWYFGIDVKDYEAMFKKAHELEPNNLLYREDYYYKLRAKNPLSPELITYAQLVLNESNPIKEQLKHKGMVGEYILGMKENWCKEILHNAINTPNKAEA